MGTPIESGLPGVSLFQGDHVCAFYHGTVQRDEVLLPYLRAGMAAGEHCVSIVDAGANAVWQELCGGDGPAAVHVLDPEDAYLVDGLFDTDRMLEFWDRTARLALDGDAPLVRAVGEMTWSLRDAPGVDQLIRYEARLNDFLPRYPQVILCLYDLERFSGAVVMGMLSTHPKVLMNGVVRDNPYFIAPDDFLGR